jgi:hypothetical protein
MYYAKTNSLVIEEINNEKKPVLILDMLGQLSEYIAIKSNNFSNTIYSAAATQ